MVYSLTGTPAAAIASLTCLTVNVPKWKTLAASTASASASTTASAKCSSSPAPPLAMTGMLSSRGDGARERDVEAVLRAVAVHAREQDLTRAETLGLARPLDGVELGVDATAVDEDLPAVAPTRHAARVDGDDDALCAVDAARQRDEARVAHRGRVERDLVGARLEHRADVVGRAHAAADRVRDEALLGGVGGDVEHRGALLVRGGDVEEDDLVGAGLVVDRGHLDGVARVAQVHEVDAFDHAARVDVETGYDALHQHGQSPLRGDGERFFDA